MSLPANFSGYPKEELDRVFRNLCIEFKKALHQTKDIDLLQDHMEQFLNIAKEMDWHNKTSGVYHKQEGEKVAGKVWSEFKRYLFALMESPETANPQNLSEALTMVEQLILSLKVT